MDYKKEPEESKSFQAVSTDSDADAQARLFCDNVRDSSEPVPGSAAWIVANDKRARLKKDEKLIEDLSEEFPSLGRIYNSVKKE